MPRQFDVMPPMGYPSVDPEKVTWQDLSSSLVNNGMIPEVLMGAFDMIDEPLLQQAVAHIKKSKLAH